MIKFSQDKVLLLHQLMAEATGGSIGVRDSALLDSALESIFQTFGGQELYPTKEEKGARLGYNLISNHAFVDGNKRIGVYVMLTFLEVNGLRTECTDEEIVNIGISVADGSMRYEELLAWVREHIVLPNQNTEDAMNEAIKIAREDSAKGYTDLDKLFEELEK